MTDNDPNHEAYDEVTDENGVMPADQFVFNPDGVAAAWEATEGVIPMVAAPIANAFATDDAGNYFGLNPVEGVHSDRDAWFVDVEGEDGEVYEVMVEEKAVGIVNRDTGIPGRCKKVELRNDRERALYVNPAQIFVSRIDD